MNSTSLSALQPFLRPYAEWLLSAAPYAGANSVRVTSVVRSRAQQQQLYKNYLAGRSRFPAAPPGRSKHEFGLAFDMVTEPFSALHTLGAWWQSLGGEWSPTDPIHFASK
jgi:LAS superfamily LD-carboxypeptidase LdcB